MGLTGLIPLSIGIFPLIPVLIICCCSFSSAGSSFGISQYMKSKSETDPNQEAEPFYSIYQDDDFDIDYYDSPGYWDPDEYYY